VPVEIVVHDECLELRKEIVQLLSREASFFHYKWNVEKNK
jgi:hypothetical protein